MILQRHRHPSPAFGAFVDIGVHQDGLVHISAMSKTSSGSARGGSRVISSRSRCCTRSGRAQTHRADAAARRRDRRQTALSGVPRDNSAINDVVRAA
jgi:hypothetical protein